MIRRLIFAFGFLAFSISDPAVVEGQQRESVQDSATTEFVLVGANELKLVRLRIRVEDNSVTEMWSESIGLLHQFLDRDDNGFLEQSEIEQRFVSPFTLRQYAWGQFTPVTSRAPDWAKLDSDNDGRVSVEELARYYQSRSFDPAAISIGFPPWSDDLTDTLMNLIDTDKNAIASRMEWSNAVRLLDKYDANGDELLGPGELVASAEYPGTLGTILVTPGPVDNDPLVAVPLIIPQGLQELQVWSRELVRRLDTDHNLTLTKAEARVEFPLFQQLDVNQDELLSSSELVHWRTQADAFEIEIDLTQESGTIQRLDESGKESNRLAYLDLDNLQFSMVVVPGVMCDAQREAKSRFQAQFESVDRDDDGKATQAEVGASNLLEFSRLAALADQNGDEILDHEELQSWIACQEMMTRAQVSLTLLSYGPGLFELLDSDRNGGLSRRELQMAMSRIDAWGGFANDQFVRERLPFQLHTVISRGRPRELLSFASYHAPDWFSAMDRNHDGDLSHGEFLGKATDFRRLDLDRDGLISSSESLSAEGRVRNDPAK